MQGIDSINLMSTYRQIDKEETLVFDYFINTFQKLANYWLIRKEDSKQSHF